MQFRSVFIGFALSVAAVLPARADARGHMSVDTLRGRVVGKDGAALAEAEVQLVELGRSATSNRAGEFVFTRLPGGTQTILVRRVGYAPVVRHITLDSKEPITF